MKSPEKNRFKSSLPIAAMVAVALSPSIAKIVGVFPSKEASAGQTTVLAKDTFESDYPKVKKFEDLDLKKASLEYIRKMDCDNPDKKVELPEVPVYTDVNKVARYVGSTYIPGENVIDTWDIDPDLEGNDFYIFEDGEKVILEKSNPESAPSNYDNGMTFDIPEELLKDAMIPLFCVPNEQAPDNGQLIS